MNVDERTLMVWFEFVGERRRTRVVAFISRMWVMVTGSIWCWRGSDAVRSSWGTELWTIVAIVRLMLVLARWGEKMRGEMVEKRCMCASMTLYLWDHRSLRETMKCLQPVKNSRCFVLRWHNEIYINAGGTSIPRDDVFSKAKSRVRVQSIQLQLHSWSWIDYNCTCMYTCSCLIPSQVNQDSRV